LSGVVSNPIQGYNIAYATHPYNYGDKQRGTWDAAFGFMARTAPVIATEFGDHTSCNTSYASQFFEYARSNSIQWTAWAWYPGGCQFPSLISDWGGTPTAFGEMVRQELKRHP
jgi:hypothetical protein